MKKIISITIFFIACSTFAQTKLITKTGSVEFEASVAAFEEVRAKTESTTAIINTETGEFAALILVKGFRFKNALMEEHFNENYAESHDFPKATFKGKLSNFDIKNLKDTYKMDGSLTFHGKTTQLKDVACNTVNTENGLLLTGSFITSAEDYDIEIPKIVSKKIAEDIEVSFSFDLKKK